MLSNLARLPGPRKSLADATVISPFGNTPHGGMVTFCEGTVVLGSSQVNRGAAYLTIPFAVEGKHFIKAVYAGDSTYRPSSHHSWQVVNLR